MTDNHIEKFLEKAKDIKLQEKRKDLIRQEILLQMKQFPFEEKGNPKAWFSFWAMRNNILTSKTLHVGLAGIALLLLVGGVASVKAESSLPGDFLYPVKIGLNEKAIELLAFSDEAKIKVHIILAERRLQEIEKLTIQGKINNDIQAQVGENFKSHANDVAHDINKLNNDNGYKRLEATASNFEASLRAHEHVLNSLEKDALKKTLDPIINNVKDATSHISSSRIDLNNKIFNNLNEKTEDESKVFQEKLSDVENSVNSVKKLIDDKKDMIGTDGVSELKDNLKAVDQKIIEGKDNIKKNQHDYRGSISSLQEAGIIAQESKDLIKEKTRLRVNIPIGISAPKPVTQQPTQDMQKKPLSH